MKKIFSLMVFAIFSFMLISCDRDSNSSTIDNDTYSVVYDVAGTFTLMNDTYTIGLDFNSPIPASDMILVYRNSGTYNGNTVWELIPRTLYLTEGELDYDFVFSRARIEIYAGGNVDIAAQSDTWKNSYINNQKFRVLVIPASLAGKKQTPDYSKYDEVIKFYNINDAQPTQLK